MLPATCFTGVSASHHTTVPSSDLHRVRVLCALEHGCRIIKAAEFFSVRGWRTVMLQLSGFYRKALVTGSPG